MEDVLEDLISFASGSNASRTEDGMTSNLSCDSLPPQARKMFTPFGSFGMVAFVTYFLPIVVVIGICGNIVTFIIIKESSHRIVGHFYIKMLTILDSLSLICLLPALWAGVIVRPYHHHLDPYSYTWADYITSQWVVCQLRLVLTFFTRTMSIYTIVLFTVERFIQVTRPFLGQRICNTTNAKKSMIVLAVISLAFSLPYIWTFDQMTITKCGSTQTTCRSNEYFFKMRFVKMFLLSVIPSFIITICNVVIVLKMRKSVRSIYRQPADGDKTDTDGETEKKQNKELTIRLLSVSCAFVVLNMPLFVVTSVHNVFELMKRNDHKRGAWADAFYFSLLLFVINLSINFILYCFTGRLFRKAAWALFLCRMDKMRYYRSSMAPGSRTTRSTSVPRSESGRKLLKQKPSFQESQM